MHLARAPREMCAVLPKKQGTQHGLSKENKEKEKRRRCGERKKVRVSLIHLARNHTGQKRRAFLMHPDPDPKNKTALLM